ncbi:type II secretion system protein M [Brevundimonas sp. AJA228-03]|uniref:type II secretion system protein GspM n=1 Tax=Brevundimonas sp. AJA228-03 TaxID=2752515 RepID=UPI001ADF7B92|nr:type II secretion system protein GspM [Brevundimonas sp. AJA228-03]QTN20487.1 type II secretion system protein M [Brevundimonas sp. AJA228-03]
MKAPVLLNRASPALDAATAWYAGRSRREQILLAVLGGLLTVAVLWLLILRPLLDARATAIDRIAAYETVMVRIRTAGPIAPTAASLSGPLETAIPAQAATFGIIPASVTPDGDAATVTVTEARYDSVIPWLAGLEASGATLSSVRIDRGSQAGAVNVSVRVQP